MMNLIFYFLLFSFIHHFHWVHIFTILIHTSFSTIDYKKRKKIVKMENFNSDNELDSTISNIQDPKKSLIEENEGVFEDVTIEHVQEMKQIIDDDQFHSVIYNIEDPVKLLTNENEITGITVGDAAIDLIGIVKSIEQPANSIEKDGMSLNVLNVIIECENNVRILIVVWNDDIKRLKPFIVLNNLIHIDSPFARSQKPSIWNNNKNYIMTCRSNTVINTLRSYKSLKLDNVELVIKEFDEIQKCIDYAFQKKQEMIKLTCFIKNEFRKDNSRNAKYFGVITDCKLKLFVYLYEYNTDVDYKQGQKVTMTGRLIENNNKLFFEIISTNDIQVEKASMPSEQLEKLIIKVAKRSNINEPPEQVLKKTKMD